jgi:membrane protein
MDSSDGKSGFFTKRLWELDPAAIGGFKGEALQLLQFVCFVGANFIRNDALLRATALSFTSLLSLVPLLALAFSVLKGLGAQNRLAPFILKQVAAGQEVVVNRVISYIGNTNMGSVGAIGLAALLYTSISMLGSVESAFNGVWGVTETRSYYRKFTDYVSVLVSAPLLLLAATSITTSLQSRMVINWFLERTYLGDIFLFFLSLTPYFTVWAALFLLYIFIPNTQVRAGSALIGAVFAGTLWELAQWGYIHFQVGAGNYNAIYGTLAALPILMIWIYASWIIVLFGMEVVAAHQNRRTFRRDLRSGEVSESFRELVALASLRHIAQAFHEGSPPWGEAHLAGRLRVPDRLMRETLKHLEDTGLIVHASGAGSPYYPARELEQIPLDQVLLSLRRRGPASDFPGEEQAKSILEQAETGVSQALRGLTLKELCVGEKIPRAVDKGGAVDI